LQKGQIYQKGASWWMRWKSPVMQDGHKKWINRYVRLAPAAQFTSAAQVEKAGLAAKHRAGLDTSRMTPSSMQRVSDFVEHIYFPKKIESNALRPSTVVGYRNLYRRHLKSHFDRRLCDFKLQDAQQLIDAIAREKPLSSQTLKHIKWFSVSVFNLAAQMGAFDANLKNPVFEIDIPRNTRKSEPTRHATLDDVIAMLEVLDEPAATVLAVAAFSGLRKSEIQGLRWEDWTGSELHVRRTAWRTTDVREQTKSEASSAPVPMIPILAKYLEAHRNGARDGFIFTGPKMGRPLDLKNIAARIIRPALKAAGIPWCGWHGFRRGLSTSLYEMGVDARTRQAILRHANLSITEKFYTKAVSAVSQDAMAKIEAAFNKKMKARKV
jgi:integrase